MYNLNHPLVSVIMPCYNDRKTLPMALASLRCQSYDHWELVFVDDGSTDGSANIVAAVGDPRFRVIRLDRNYGRGAARQRCNEEAQGEFIAMLDADDWWYTTKLDKQLHFFQMHPEIAMVGGGMIIMDDTDHPIGVRCCHKLLSPPMAHLKDPPLAYATVMMRRNVVDSFRYNTTFHLAQDVDFLQRVCLHKPFANLPAPLYVYTEYQGYTWRKVRQSFRYRIASWQALTQQYPFQARREIVKIFGKLLLYSCAHLFGQERRMLARRSHPLSNDLLQQFMREQDTVTAMRDRMMKDQL